MGAFDQEGERCWMRLRTTVADQPIRLTGSTAFAVQNNALQSENAALRAALRDMRDLLKDVVCEPDNPGCEPTCSDCLRGRELAARADELLGKE